MPDELPAITGKQLIRLLKKDGWKLDGKRNHGVALVKTDANGYKQYALVPDKRSSLPPSTLGGILSVKQSCIGRDGLLALIEQYGLR